MKIRQERSVVGTLRQPLIYETKSGDLLEVVWSGQDRALLPDEPHEAMMQFRQHARRWERKGGRAA